ncbi:hypothetical protein G3N96_15135 [Burkholderia sp. Se-20373]|uniref:hypothetical protein n=1 Tax=Burkholderia sp. Se-20373 TaxID=2703898 RepID=UPI00197F8CE5|nr:hypothetical protein [Burkholderia sp. Se-20373]MBN3746760.1 hypothetical protein [Burkholderia sp. Se-20373]
MIPRNRPSRQAGALGVFVKRNGRDVERTMRRVSAADLSDRMADDDGSIDDAEAEAGFADARRTP